MGMQNYLKKHSKEAHLSKKNYLGYAKGVQF
jgi:hypothetical protein